MLTKIFYHFYDYKKKPINLISCILLAIVLVILGLFNSYSTNESTFSRSERAIIIDITLYPFILISKLLKSLALASSTGNLIAIIILGLICALPLISYVSRCIITRKHFSLGSFTFNIILGAMIGIIIYYLINPSLISLPKELAEILKYEYVDDLIKKALDDFRKIFLWVLVIVLIQIIILYIIYYLININKNNLNLFKAAKYFLMFQRICYTILFIIAFFSLPGMFKNDLIGLINAEFGILHIFVLIIVKYSFLYLMTFLMLKVLRTIHDLLVNFTNEILFSVENVIILKKCSRLFLINAIASFTYQIIWNIYQFINKSNIPIEDLKFIVGFPYASLFLTLLFYLLALVMHQSYEIYTENSLTI